jgi:hypothetical protein
MKASDGSPMEEDDASGDWMDIDEAWAFKRAASPDVYAAPPTSTTFSREPPRPRVGEVHATAGTTYGNGPNARLRQVHAEMDPSNPLQTLRSGRWLPFWHEADYHARKLTSFFILITLVRATFPFIYSNTYSQYTRWNYDLYISNIQNSLQPC